MGTIVPLRSEERESRPTPLQRLQALRRTLSQELFDNEGLATVFTHARNVLTSAMLIAAGLYAVRHPRAAVLPALWTVHVAGYIVSAAGLLLLLLNLVDGLRRLSGRHYGPVLRVLAIVAYIALSLRLTQVLIYFRAAL